MIDDTEIIFLKSSQLTSANVLEEIAQALGNPTDCSTESGWKLMEAIVDFWEYNFTQEVNDWKHDRAIDLETEKDLPELVKGFGYNPVTYPPHLYEIIRLFLPEQSLTDKNFILKLAKRFPIFRSSNHI